jgi:hypothetical protein
VQPVPQAATLLGGETIPAAVITANNDTFISFFIMGIPFL